MGKIFQESLTWDGSKTAKCQKEGVQSATCKERHIPYKYQANSRDIVFFSKATKCNQATAPSLPIRFHDKWMFFTVVLTFNASARACERKRYQTMSNQRGYNAICANIHPRAIARQIGSFPQVGVKNTKSSKPPNSQLLICNYIRQPSLIDRLAPEKWWLQKLYFNLIGTWDVFGVNFGLVQLCCLTVAQPRNVAHGSAPTVA